MKTHTIRLHLTRDLVEKHRLPSKHGVVLACDDLRGFNVLLTSKGSRSYYVHARRKGAPRTAPPIKFTFGEVGKTKFGDARETARQLLADLAKGKDIRIKADDGETFAAAAATFLAARTLRARTLGHYTASGERLAKWKDRGMRSITATEVKAEYIRLKRDFGEATASQTLRFFRAVWNFHFAEFDNPPLCPTAVLNRSRANLWMPSKKRKTRVIPADKLPAWWAAVGQLPNHWPLYFQMQLLTGARKTELLLLRAERVSMAAKTITLPDTDTKSKRDLVLPLGPWLVKRIKPLLAKTTTGPLFGAEIQQKRHVKRVKDEIEAAWGSHDLRRMFRNAAAACGVPDLVVKALLNHSLTSDVTDGYSTDVEKPKRDAILKIERYLLRKAKAK